MGKHHHVNCKEEKKKIQFFLLSFIVIFCFLAFRTPKDLFTSYLWAEDGSILIQGSIYDGISGIFIPGNGAYWIIQKLIALFCYYLVLPTKSIAALPYLMQVLSKVLGTFSVMYFLSDRFQWLVSNKYYRFGICITIVLLMPQNSYDVLTCDTSLPFELFFVVFLIGLDMLCSEKKEPLNYRQVLFFTLLALSSASALCIATTAGAITLQWLIFQIKKRTLKTESALIEIGKMAIVLGATFVQLKCIFSAGRVSGDLDLIHRLILNTKSFVFFPYWNQFHSWAAFGLGLTIYISFYLLGKLPWKVMIYCSGFNYLFMLYCSMTSSTDSFYTGEMTGRYIFTCFEISALLLGVVITRMLQIDKPSQKYIGYFFICVTAILSLSTYNIPVVGEDLAGIYETNCVVYAIDGNDEVRIPIGPFSPWILRIPANISSKIMINDLEFGVEYLDGKLVGSENFGEIDKNVDYELVGWAKTSVKDQTFERLFIKQNSIYTSAYKISERASFHTDELLHNGVEFRILEDYLTETPYTWEIVGQTSDGVWHCGIVTIN